VTTARLQTITTLFDAGRITTRVGSVLPLSEARQAQGMLAGAPHKPGKIACRWKRAFIGEAELTRYVEFVA
jgi:hypothetical protein